MGRRPLRPYIDMTWTINTASVIGRGHELKKLNNQDWYGTWQDDDYLIGVVCDGCGSGRYSEVGAALLGNHVLNLLRLYNEPYQIANYIYDYINRLLISIIDTTSFIREYLLTTIIFAYYDIYNNELIIGRAGDGVVCTSHIDSIYEQNNIPDYIAYHNVPHHDLNGYIPKYFEFDKEVNPDKFIIGTDGMAPLIPDNSFQLYGTKGRQLQRKFNLWQRKDKLFEDDATCIVFERNEES